jgi:cobalt/nickel transport system permease protein
MYTARRSRTVKDDGDVKEGRRFVAASAATLFGKAHQTSEEVHQATTARGYTGNARTIDTFRLTATDALWTVLAIVAAVAIVWIDWSPRPLHRRGKGGEGGRAVRTQ